MKLRDKAKLLQPAIRIGKNGITDDVVKEIKSMLDDKGLIKIKFLKTALQDKKRKELATELAKKTNSEMIMAVGFVVVLYKKET